MCADRQRCRGQAIVETLVAMIALVPLYFGIAWVAKLIDARQATIAASRALAFECALRPAACRDAQGSPALAGELRQRFFASPSAGLRSDERATAAVEGPDGRVRWRDRTGASLLERFEDVSIGVEALRFDSPLAFAGGLGDRTFPGALRTLSELGGPGRFGLAIDAGLLRARVTTRLSRHRPEDGWVSALIARPLTLEAGLAILTDTWDASGPYGPAPDSVETRVDAGARLPGLEPALAAGWLPVRGLQSVAATLGIESSAAALRWHEVDVDLVPARRLGGQADVSAAPPAAPSFERP
jgi:hypothetical protein